MAYYYGELPQPDHFYGYTYFATHGRTDAPIELPSMYLPEEPEADPAPVPEQDPAPDPVPDTPEVPSAPFDPTGIVAAPEPEPEPEEAQEPAKTPEPSVEAPTEALPPPETPAPPQETPKAPIKKDTGKEPLTPSFSIPNPAMFYP